MTSLQAKRAARALYQATEPHGTARATLDGLIDFMALLQDNTELRDVVTSVFVPPSTKGAVISRVADAMGLAPAARQTLLILAEMRHPAGLAAIIRELKALVHRQERRVDAEVTTAVPLDADQVSRVQAALAAATGAHVSVIPRVDPAVIGGVVTRIGSLVYDGSLARQLARLKEQFASHP